ncbi:MAG: methyltransferase domain-containing protein [bacterium]
MGSVKVESGTLDSRAIRSSFSRSSIGYDKVTGFHREEAGRLWRLIQAGFPLPEDSRRGWGKILDIGSGTGNMLYCLKFPFCRFFCLDISQGMNLFLREKSAGTPLEKKSSQVTGEGERLPFPAGTFDLVVSNLAFQWCADPEKLFREIRAVLKPGGGLGFSWFGESTLLEIQEIYKELSPVGAGNYLHPFYSVQEMKAALIAAGFAITEERTREERLFYRNAAEMLRWIKMTGGQNAGSERPRGLGRRSLINAFIREYDRRFRTDASRVYATFAVGSFTVKIPEGSFPGLEG